MTYNVVKRNGVKAEFDKSKIETAIKFAFERDIDNIELSNIVSCVLSCIEDTGKKIISTEEINDFVERCLMDKGHYEEARNFILYRQQHKNIRKISTDNDTMSQYIFQSRYSRYIPKKRRRETWNETVDRVRDMHIEKYPNMEDELIWAFEQVRQKTVLPSMRALEDSTPINTRNGWKTAGEVEVGDVLYSSSGKETNVIGVSKFENKELFEITFTDGEKLVSCSEHLWIVSNLDDIRNNSSRVVDTEYIMNNIERNGRPFISISLSEPLRYSIEDLPIDPYILGHWLGDGYSSGYQISSSIEDAKFICEKYESAGFKTKQSNSSNIWTYSVNGLRDLLKDNNLLNNKHIPEKYIRSSYEQRLQLIQGLMDSDGCITEHGRCLFYNTNKLIIDSFCEIITSMGIKCTLEIKEPKNENHLTGYVVSFFTNEQVVTLPRKMENLKGNISKRNTRRFIKSCEYIGNGNATCFHVDSDDHSFLAGNKMIVTHNSMQFGGKPILDKNERIYNCSASPCDRPEFFSQVMELLLAGCGVGFDVTFENINKLPTFVKPDETKIEHIEIQDSIEGWADCIDKLIDSYVKGYIVEFSYKKIRPIGSKIKSGGLAPGHVPLRKSVEKIRNILENVVKKFDGIIKPIDAYDIVMHIADAVLSGGVRRSATICLFSPDDNDMMSAKTGNWFETNPQRARSNNSVKLYRETTTFEQFKRIFEKQIEFGEPGFYFIENNDYLTNPCCEIGLNSKLNKGYVCSDGEILDDNKTGFSFCNLTTINGSMLKDMYTFENAVKAATIIGTCQAGYTDFKYLGKISSEVAKRESLLGVSITGIMDSPEITLVPENLRKMAKLAIDVNKDVSKRIGINPAARITTVKPEGTTSILLNTASGIHPRHSERYFRRIQANKNDPVYKHFKEKNPHCCEPSVWSTNGTDDVITFCVKSPDGAIVKSDISAIEFLKIVKMVQENWVIPGTAIPESSPGLTHNVSNTVTFKMSEKDELCKFIYDNREYFTGISLLIDSGDTIYQQAPHQQISSDDDELIWANYMEAYEKIDYTKLNEDEDKTNHKNIVVCSGGKCDISLDV